MLIIKEFFNSIFRRSSNHTHDSSVQAFIAEAHAEMLEQQKHHADTWQYGKENAWSADLRAGIIVFKFSGEHTGMADFQMIGMYDETEGVFVWGWAHDAVPKALKAHAMLAKKWGRLNNHPAYSSKRIHCSLEEAWDFAAVSCKLAGARGVYRGHAGSKFIFMTIDEIHIDKEAHTAHWARVITP